jgi:beta-galactosidase
MAAAGFRGSPPLAQAAREKVKWPFAWVSGVDYPHRDQRGAVSGRVVLRDTEASTQPMRHLLVGLAAPDYPLPGGTRGQSEQTADWQRDAKYYQFWIQADPDGRFQIPNVRPGKYTLHAIADGVLGEYIKTDMVVTSGKTLDLGALDWKPVRFGRQLWEIGTPDRSAAEFRHGDHYWEWGLYLKYPQEFPNDVHFVIGKSDVRTDWNYCQPPRDDGKPTTWSITFALKESPHGKATLRLALAATSARRISVTVNDQPAGETGLLPDTATIRRDGIRGYWYERDVAFDASMMHAGDNVLKLTIPPGGVMSGVEYDYLRLELAPIGGVTVTTPLLTDARATVRVHSTVENGSGRDRRLSMRVRIVDPAGHPQASVDTPTVAAAVGKTQDYTAEVTIPKPALWDLNRPRLYTARVTVLDGKTPLDSETVTFGLREARFDAATGFWLNGANLKIKGACLHQEAGALGMAVPRSIWERRLAKLKEFGVNAIRTAHTPFSPEFLEICDRLGLLVMDEMFDCWTVGKTPYDYHVHFKEWAQRDAHDTVVRDRNHPSVILYSIGNEIHDTPNAALARGILTSLRDVVHEADPTRPVTQALFRPNASHDYTDGLADLLDVIGQNYRENEILAAHRDRPERKILGTENTHDRRVWLAMRDNPAYAGQFLWTGIDYLGEAKRWPAISFDYGLFDRTLNPHPRGYERQSWWSAAPMIAIARRVAPTPRTPTDPGYEAFQPTGPTLLCDWSPRNTDPHAENVEVYSNCEQVELFLNKRSLGVQSRPTDASPRKWNVAFAPGELRAVGKNGDRVVAETTLHTAGKPARLVLTTDRTRLSSDWDDVACITAQVTDAEGTPIPNASDNISFRVTGPGVLAGVDNGDLYSHESFQATERHAYSGQCLAIVRASGPAGQFTLAASAAGFLTVQISVQTTGREQISRP